MKKILFPVAAMSILALLTFNLNLNTKKDAANLLTLTNMEALAQEVIVLRPCCSDLRGFCDYEYEGEKWQESGRFIYN